VYELWALIQVTMLILSKTQQVTEPKILNFTVSILFNLYSKCLTKEALEDFGVFKIGGQTNKTVKCAGDLVLLAEEETVLQDMIDKLIDIGSKNYDRAKTTGECGIF
jgi:hypothetical protein